MMVVKHPEGDFWLRVGNGISVTFDACTIEKDSEFISLFKNSYPIAIINPHMPGFKLLPDELRKIRVPSPFRANLIRQHKANENK